MGEENEIFKSKVFGGFDRHDVSKYIEGLAAERNSLKEENERLREQLDLMEKEYSEKSNEDSLRIAQLEEELAQERIRPHEAAIAGAEEIMSEFRRKYREFREDMELSLAHTRCELTKAKECTDGLWNMFDITEKRIDEMDKSVSELKKQKEE